MTIPLPCPPNCSPEELARLEREFATYRRELSRLLREGHAGRHAVIREDQVLSIWDTYPDASQAARERFGLEPVTIATIKPQDVERFALMDARRQARQEVPCPS